jgi:hypothetical protein
MDSSAESTGEGVSAPTSSANIEVRKVDDPFDPDFTNG